MILQGENVGDGAVDGSGAIPREDWGSLDSAIEEKDEGFRN